MSILISKYKPYIVLLILNISVLYSLQGQQFKPFRNHVSSLPGNSDASAKELNSLYKKAINENDTVNMTRNLIRLSAQDRTRLHYGSALRNSGDALFLAEELKDTLLMAQAHEEFGILNYLFKQDALAGLHFNKSHDYFNICYNKGQISLSDLYNAQYNLVLYYQRIVDKELLGKAIDSCEKIAQKADLDTIYKLYLNEKRASLYEWNNQAYKAEKMLTNSINGLNSEPHTTDKSFLIILYARLGNIYRDMGQLDRAKENYQKSIQVKDSSGEHTFYRSYVFLKYGELLSRLGDYKNAYNNLFRANAINEMYLNPRNDSNQGFLTIRNQYNEQINRKNKQLNLQRLELANKGQKILRLQIYIFVVIAIMAIIGLITRSRIKILKHQKVERDSKQLIDIKNEELTINTLQLIEREKVIELLSDHIDKSDLSKTTRTLLNSIEKRSVNLWNDFNNRFLSQNEGFYERLLEKVPDLSSADLKICALIKLNFSGKEMAYLLGISLGSVHVSRHRLRKKMDIGREINLSTYINSI